MALVKKDNDADHLNVLFEVITPQNNQEKVKEALMNNKLLENLRLVSVNKEKLFGLARAICVNYCPFINITNGFLRHVSSINGEIFFSLVGSNYECRQAMKELVDSGVLYRVAELSTVKDVSGMTGRQELVLRVAYELGYFDYPKKIKIRELAAIFKVTPATLAEEIRKGLKKVLTNYFNEAKTPFLENEYYKKMDEYVKTFLKS